MPKNWKLDILPNQDVLIKKEDNQVMLKFSFKLIGKIKAMISKLKPVI